MAVVPATACGAEAAGDQEVQEDGVAGMDAPDGGADLRDPAGVLVSDHGGQRDARLLSPLSLQDVEVGAAHTGTADANDDVERAGDRRLGYLLETRRLVVGVDTDGSHALTSARP